MVSAILNVSSSVLWTYAVPWESLCTAIMLTV